MIPAGDTNALATLRDVLYELEGFHEAIGVMIDRITDADVGSDDDADLLQDNLDTLVQRLDYQHIDRSCGNALPEYEPMDTRGLVSSIQGKIEEALSELNEDLAAYEEEQNREDEDDDDYYDEDGEDLVLPVWHEGPSDPEARLLWLKSNVPGWEKFIAEHPSGHIAAEMNQHVPRLRAELDELLARERLGL